MTNISSKKPIKILAIESSCDETSAAVLEVCHPEFISGSHKEKILKHPSRLENQSEAEVQNDNLNIKILSNVVSSQVKLHSKYGGVYPELASREHVKNIIPVLEATLQQTNSRTQKRKNNLVHKFISSSVSKFSNEIDYLAVTTTPGLIGSLLAGVNTVKTLSFTTSIPIIPVNHLEGHIYANFITDELTNEKTKKRKKHPVHKFISSSVPEFPLLALVVSGGHTSLIYMKDHIDYKIIGETIDDAAGEAYDKVAKMLGLGYPGGPIIDAIASKFLISNSKFLKKSQYFKSKIRNNNLAIEQFGNSPLFPRPLINKNNFNFSFSGLKTAVLYYAKDKKITKNLQAKIAYEFQEAVTDVLVTKTLKAAQKYKVKSIILGGGVAANSRLRNKFKSNVKCQMSNVSLHIPPIKYCTDNAAVIGAAAVYKLLKEKPVKWYDIEAKANSEL